MGAEFLQYGRTGGETDRHDEANSRIAQFCEHTLKNGISASPLLTVIFVNLMFIGPCIIAIVDE